MTCVAFHSPFIPPEWIAAHGLQPLRVVPERGDAPTPAPEGMCGYAAAVLDSMPTGADALILATTCDQMRRATDLAEPGTCHAFTFDVPATWRTQSARQLYKSELRRLARHLVSLGGYSPTADVLRDTMIAYDLWRRRFLEFRSAVGFRRGVTVLDVFYCRGAEAEIPEPSARPSERSIPLLLLGGPLSRADRDMLETLEDLGGRIVHDGTEMGERAWPAAFDKQTLDADPFEALATAYFDSIPDAFRRPNTLLYHWIDESVTRQPVRGAILFERRWCDLWNAERERIREALSVPLLSVDLDGNGSGHGVGRIQAFLEMLR